MHAYPVQVGARALIVEMDRGEKVIETVEAELAKAGIKNAFIASAVGSIQRVKGHKPNGMEETAVDVSFDIQDGFEIASLTGTVIDGSAHFHFSVVAPDGSMQAGHLEMGTEIMYLGEVTLVELSGCNLERRFTPENVRKLFVKG